jgi:ribonuclease HI
MNGEILASSEAFQGIIIFTDGACSGNPGPGGWGAIVVYPQGQVRELGGGADATTNNRMELQATISALYHCRDEANQIHVFTDSVYVIRGITQWIWGWRKRGWKNAAGDDVANKDLWEQLSAVVSRRPSTAGIQWHYVRGHIGVPGNERADEIAVSYTKGFKPELYQGPLIKYSIPIHDIPEDTSLPEPKSQDKNKKPSAFSYLSLVDGMARRHTTWAECERLVKGRSGARFKKAISADNEVEILASWGVDPSQVN